MNMTELHISYPSLCIKKTLNLKAQEATWMHAHGYIHINVEIKNYHMIII